MVIPFARDILVLVTLLGLSLVSPIDQNSTLYCLGDSFPYIFMATDIENPEYSDPVDSANRIRELLIGPTRDPWASADGPGILAGLIKIGSISKNALLGAAFEGRRHGAPEAGEFVIFHI